MNYILTRSRRKTLSITVRADGTVEVKAPLNCSKERIDRFISEKSDWIEKYVTENKAKSEQFKFSGTIPFMGKQLPVTEGDCFMFSSETGFTVPKGRSIQECLPQLEYVYRKAAAEYLPKRVQYFSGIMGVSPSAVKVNGAEKRWGSCSGRGTINFSWRLMAASSESIDYVVVHEMAHLTELNHSPKFWKIVADVLPDYKERQSALAEITLKLNGIFR